MNEASLLLVSATKSRPGEWPEDDYDVHEGGRDGPVIGRIYKNTFSPSETPWFWGLMLFPPMPADHGEEETREAAMAALKAQWIAPRAGSTRGSGWDNSTDRASTAPPPIAEPP